MNSRRKGKTNENELARLLSLELGTTVVRNLDQVRDGGVDLLGVPFAVEVKAQRKPQLATWWAQAVDQAKKAGKAPALAYKVHYRGWKFRLPLSELVQDVPKALYWDYEWSVEMGIEPFCLICRERIQPQPGDLVRVSGVPYRVEVGK